ncbi:right-handed parallel beta-helix repeat-containing protein [Arenicella sp.]|nr:right-handed parallel beta-helix repeat-containing protein [Arenicella sp.]
MLSTKTNYIIKAALTLALLTQSSFLFALSCGDYITRDVTLQADLHCATGYEVATIAAHNITIDLNGFTVSGDSNLRGFYIRDFDNLKVINGTINGFWSGVQAFNSDNLTVDNVKFYKTGHAITSQGGNSASIGNNKFIATRATAVVLNAGIIGHSSNANNIYNNEFQQTFSAIEICGEPAQRNNIVNNRMWKTADFGIRLNHASYNKILNNQLLETSGSAIRLDDSSYNQIIENTLSEGDASGITLATNSSTGCLNNTFDGVSGRSLKNQIIDNRISGFSTAVELGVVNISLPTLVGNQFSYNDVGNADVGILLDLDTKYNYGRGNVYYNVNQHVQDLGTRNSVD